jgi:peptidoglycan hydrolase-like protein with peptidoglycan-binding domain
MSSAPTHSAAQKHTAARKRGLLRHRVAGVALAASAILITGLGLGPPAQAAGSVWDRVAVCESGGNWAVNSGNTFYGGLQFTKATWLEFGGGRYAPYAHKASRAAQIGIARRVLGTQGPAAWPVCSKRAGLNRVTGGAVRYATATVSRAKARVAIPSHAKLEVDGRMGPKTVKAIQRWVGTTRNGVFGVSTVKALQRKVGVRADGALGPRTVRALQGKIGARRDGSRHLNASTVAALQRYLNRH